MGSATRWTRWERRENQILSAAYAAEQAEYYRRLAVGDLTLARDCEYALERLAQRLDALSSKLAE